MQLDQLHHVHENQIGMCSIWISRINHGCRLAAQVEGNPHGLHLQTMLCYRLQICFSLAALLPSPPDRVRVFLSVLLFRYASTLYSEILFEILYAVLLNGASWSLRWWWFLKMMYAVIFIFKKDFCAYICLYEKV